MTVNERKIISGVVFLYTVIIFVFSLPGRLSVLLVTEGSIKKGLAAFLHSSTLWVIILAVAIFVLNIYVKKYNQHGYFELIENSVIRITSGMLVALDGIVSLSSALPTQISSVHSLLKISYQFERNVQPLVYKYIFVSFAQIILGIYLARYYKRKPD